ncbi:MAG: hypothetical protein GFH27_549445n1 [Chloroflexi bacterium AL-W]|nr:hypothetical protein [Chloroflexi bacterium AL-N1]NOK71657.1 hypothetical protein [Chloroflexi bacterium AL-N10]NOK78998.1 hypothetical protein [Chloroflexi bacterium AL-N5]NOK86432.1 hypothetical protein [Chloroflexi bacterium AL-W]NOK93398.1 hypothetical protein [Chloroflexi bacterium AL-N15]
MDQSEEQMSADTRSDRVTAPNCSNGHPAASSLFRCVSVFKPQVWLIGVVVRVRVTRAPTLCASQPRGGTNGLIVWVLRPPDHPQGMPVV